MPFLGRLGELIEIASKIPPDELVAGNLPIAPVQRTPESTAGTLGALLGRAADRRVDGADDPSGIATAVQASRIVAGAVWGPTGVAVVEGNIRALELAGAGIAAMTELEQSLTTACVDSMLPFRPAPLPAVTTGALSFGLPHAHMHPPNLVPPNPVPTPLPSLGPVLPIPYLSGASTVLVCGQGAARCGDMGLALWCGGYFPMFEIELGSSSVWIEGMRAARGATDVTSHCMFSSPRPTDPPLGPMIGMIPFGTPTVLIGGIPMPSLTSLAIAGALRLVFAIGGRAYLRFTGRARVDRLVARGSLHIVGDAAYVAMVKEDLVAIAGTRSGREVLERIESSGRRVTIEPLPPLRYEGGVLYQREHNAFARQASWEGSFDVHGNPGDGCDVTVSHSPDRWANHGGGDQLATFQDAQGNWWNTATPPPAGTASDEMLMHELNHAGNFANGEGRNSLRGAPLLPDGSARSYTPGGPEWAERWTNGEEFDTVWAENGYRRERRGAFARQRTGYGKLL